MNDTDAFISAQATAISSKCRKFALPAFCYFVFPQCDKSSSNVFHKSKRLCREDCNILKNDVCFNEFVNNTKDPYLKVRGFFVNIIRCRILD